MTELSIPRSLERKGTFRILEDDPPANHRPREFTALLIDAPVVTAGYAGWAKVARPRKKALTEWVGRDPASITLSFIIDNFDEGAGLYVESQCQILDELAGIEKDDPEPPLLILETDPDPLMPHGFRRAAHNRWFIESLSWDAANVRYNNAGNRVRATGTIVFTQHVQDDRIRVKVKNPKITTYIVKKGDTLRKIAALPQVYGDSKQWKKIAKANGIRDPNKLRVGRRIKIP